MSSKECVILLHGFGCTSYVFSRIERHLNNASYHTLAINYLSRQYKLLDLINNHIIKEINSITPKYDRVHFIGHSMGGIISRYIMEFHRPANLGKVILVAVPNSGSEIVKLYSKFRWFESIFGPALSELSIGTPFLSQLPSRVDYEVGVISGNFSINPFHSLFILPGEDDGTVSVESTKIMGMKDHIVIPATHTMILYNEHAIKEIEHFIRYGIFSANKREQYAI